MDDATAQQLSLIATRLRELYVDLVAATTRRRSSYSTLGPRNARLVEAELLLDLPAWMDDLRPLLVEHRLSMIAVAEPGPPVIVERYEMPPGDVPWICTPAGWTYGRCSRVEIAASDSMRARLLELGESHALVLGDLGADGRTLERVF